MSAAQKAVIPAEALKRREADTKTINDYIERVVVAFMVDQPDTRMTRDDIPKITKACRHELITERDVRNVIEAMERPTAKRRALIRERTTRGGDSFNGWEFPSLPKATPTAA